MPLLQVPHGCVNVHGHVHQKESPTKNRHINVSVEQLDYRPVKLSASGGWPADFWREELSQGAVPGCG